MLYVYAIVDRAPATGLPVTGIDAAPLTVVDDDGVAAVCSERSGDRPPEPEPGDLWAHEQVLEALLDACAVLPVRFGTTVRDEQELRALLDRRRGAFMTGLDLVRGRREIGVRVMDDGEDPGDADGDDALSGTGYLMRRLAVTTARRDRAAALHAALSEQAVAARHAVLATPRLLLNGAYLVDRDGVEPFLRAADELAAAHPDVRLVCTGPWPAHSFTPEELADAV